MSKREPTPAQINAESGSGESPFQKVGECLYRYTPNGKYYARIKVYGKEIRQSLGTTDRKMADRKLADFKEQQRQVDQSRAKITLKKLCDEYIETIQHQKEKTIERKKLIVRRIKNEWPGGAKVQARRVKPSDVRAWLAKYNFGPVSRNLHLRLVNEIFQRAIDDDIITVSPASKIKAEKLPKPIRRTPSFDEFKAIVANIREQKFSDTAHETADLVEFLGLAGLGLAEASALRWNDVDWTRGKLITFRHKTKSGFAVPLYPQLRPLLERRFAERQSEYVFTIKNAKKALASACERLGLPRYSHIAFRRMFITRALELGVNVRTVAEWQGHRDGGKLILGTYSHVRTAHSDRMAALMI